MDDRIGERWFKEIFLKQCGTDRPQVLILDNKGNNKITELRAILQREVKTHKYINRQNQSTTGKL